MIYKTINQKATIDLGVKLGKSINSDWVVLLQGELGAGKTTFVKGMNKALGGKRAEVVSPTYTYVNDYHSSNLLHFDLYRSAPGAFDLEFMSYLEDYNYPIVIEWYDRLSPRLLTLVSMRKKIMYIDIITVSQNERKFNVRYPNID